MLQKDRRTDGLRTHVIVGRALVDIKKRRTKSWNNSPRISIIELVSNASVK